MLDKSSASQPEDSTIASLSQSSPGVYRHLLASYLAPQRRRMVVLAILLFGSIGLQLLNPQILRVFIDTVTDPR